jgi:hypothetical protein
VLPTHQTSNEMLEEVKLSIQNIIIF